MRCYICCEERPSSEEHVFPQAVGGVLTTDRVCKACNDHLGSKVDVLLTDHLFAQFRRWDLKLPGCSGKVPDGVLALLGKGVMASDPEQRVRLVKNAATSSYDPRLLHKETSQTFPDGSRRIRVSMDASGGPAEVRKVITRVRRREGLPVLSDEELEQLVQQTLANTQRIEQPEVLISVDVDVARYPLGLLKIAYELACMWLGDAYLDDPMAAVIRDVLLGKMQLDEAPIRGKYDLSVEDTALQLWSPDPDAHVAFSFALHGHLVICLKVFDMFSATFVVSEDAGRYGPACPEPTRHRFIRMNVRTNQVQDTTLAEAYRTVRQTRAGEPRSAEAAMDGTILKFADENAANLRVEERGDGHYNDGPPKSMW